MSTNTWYYVTVDRNGDDFTMKVFSDSARQTQFGSDVTLNVSGIENLTHLHHSGQNGGGGTSGLHFKVDNTAISYDSISDYTTNISGSLDEFFINSDVLTSTEIDNIYDRGGKGTLVTTTSASTTEYDDSSVTGGNEYYFAVAGVNAVGEGVLSSYTSGLAGQPTQAPTSVATTISSPNSNPLDVTLSWSAPTNVGTGTLTGFEIYRDVTLHNTV